MISPIPPWLSRDRQRMASLIFATMGRFEGIFNLQPYLLVTSSHWHGVICALMHVQCLYAARSTFKPKITLQWRFLDLRNTPSSPATFGPRTCVSGSAKKSIERIPSCATYLQSCGCPGHSSWVNHFSHGGNRRRVNPRWSSVRRSTASWSLVWRSTLIFESPIEPNTELLYHAV